MRDLHLFQNCATIQYKLKQKVPQFWKKWGSCNCLDITWVPWFKYFVLCISSTNLVKTKFEWHATDNWPQIPIFNGLYPVDDMFPCWLVDMMTSSHIVLVVFSSRLIYHTYVTEIQTWYYTLICFHLFLVLKPFHNIKWSLMGLFLNWRNIFFIFLSLFVFNSRDLYRFQVTCSEDIYPGF